MWLHDLFFSGNLAGSVILLAIAVAAGILLGKVKMGGVSLGVTWILFVGIILGHFGLKVDDHILHFVKEFGLILFVFSVGLQVGPGFFASLKKGGVSFNLLAACIVFLGVAVAVIIHAVTGTDLVTMAGILSGAVTNTPGLGAAQGAYLDVMGADNPVIAQGYAVAYPLGVIGIILSLVLLRPIFRINIGKLKNELETKKQNSDLEMVRLTVSVQNPAVYNKTIREIGQIITHPLVASRVYTAAGKMDIACADTVLQHGDKLLIITTKKEIDAVILFFGVREETDFFFCLRPDTSLVSRYVVVTRPKVNGRTLAELNLRSSFGVNVTRVHRSGVDLAAAPRLHLLMGDRVTVVGSEESIALAAKVLGNTVRRLREPNLVPLFAGIVLGVLLGSIPIAFPGIPQPVKLGLAGGPLIVAILISYFGPRYKFVTYTTVSANMMLRELGICLFLAAVGLGAGHGFIDTIIRQGGYMWVLYGFLITMVPLLLAGIVGYRVLKIDYFTLIGLLAGSTTDPPALAYANGFAGNDMPSVGYATVYPLTMFLRVLTAQLLILFAL